MSYDVDPALHALQTYSDEDLLCERLKQLGESVIAPKAGSGTFPVNLAEVLVYKSIGWPLTRQVLSMR